jgi:hypothetical protein
MAKEVIEIDVNVGEGVKSLGQLKQEFKDVKKELDALVPGTDKYIAKLKDFNEAKGNVEDLNNEINILNDGVSKTSAISGVVSGIASGFQAATGAAALFGAESEDVQKALLKVQAVSAFAEGIKGITEFKKGFSDLTKLAKSLVTQILGVETVTKIAAVAQRVWNAVMAANPILLVVAAVAALAGGIALLVNALENSKDATELYIEANNKAIEQSKEVVKSIDNEITALSGLAANEEKIIELKRRRYVESIKQAELSARNAAAEVKKAQTELGFLDEITASVSELIGVENARSVLQNKNSIEQKKKFIEETDALKKAKAEQIAFENEQEQKRLDKVKENTQKAKEYYDKLAESRYQAWKLQQERDAQENAASDELGRKEQEQLDKKIAAEQESARIQMEIDQQVADNKEALRLKNEEDEKLSKQAIKDAEGKSIDAMRSLSEGFFAFKSRAAKGNAAEELKVKKQMFAVDKAFNLARAIQDGIRSVQAALTIPPPGGQILAIVNGALAAGNIAKIAATQFEGGASADVGSVNVQSSGTFTQAPNVGGNGGNNQTQLNQDGSVNRTAQAPIKAYVVESESAAVTKRVNKLENQSKI